MLIIRLILIALSGLLISFGLHPALEYTNPGALLMLAIAPVLLIIAILLRPLLSLIQTTILAASSASSSF